MTEKKLTDEQIIKALECCASECEDACDDCPCVDGKCIGTTPDALDLINRQQAEIKRLTTLAKLGNMRADDYRAMRDKCKTARAEAIKEFAERLKERRGVNFPFTRTVFIDDIDNLVKEMVGEE